MSRVDAGELDLSLMQKIHLAKPRALAAEIATSLGAHSVAFIGEGSYNFAFTCVMGRFSFRPNAGKVIVIKIQKCTSIADRPERLVRLWNQINKDYSTAFAHMHNGVSYFISPFVNGDPIGFNAASDETIQRVCEKLIEIYDATDESNTPIHRVISDAYAHRNFVIDKQNRVVCVDVGLALKLGRHGSEDSLEVWRAIEDAQNEKLAKYAGKKEYFQVMSTIKALLFLNSYFPEVRKVGNPKEEESFFDIRYFLVDLYDNQDENSIHVNYLGKKLVLKYYSDEVEGGYLEKIKQEIIEIEAENPSLLKLDFYFFEENLNLSEALKQVQLMDAFIQSAQQHPHSFFSNQKKQMSLEDMILGLSCYLHLAENHSEELCSSKEAVLCLEKSLIQSMSKNEHKFVCEYLRAAGYCNLSNSITEATDLDDLLTPYYPSGERLFDSLMRMRKVAAKLKPPAPIDFAPVAGL